MVMDNDNLRFLFASALLLGLTLAASLFLLSGSGPRFRVRLPRFLRWKTRKEEIPGGVPISIASMLLGFGAAGLLLSDTLKAGFVGSILGSILAGGVLRTLVVTSLRRLVGGEATAMEGGTIVGTVCRVSLAIPADGVGAVAYHAEGKRHTVPARAAHPMPPQTQVMITDLSRGVATVEEF